MSLHCDKCKAIQKVVNNVKMSSENPNNIFVKENYKSSNDHFMLSDIKMQNKYEESSDMLSRINYIPISERNIYYNNNEKFDEQNKMQNNKNKTKKQPTKNYNETNSYDGNSPSPTPSNNIINSTKQVSNNNNTNNNHFNNNNKQIIFNNNKQDENEYNITSVYADFFEVDNPEMKIPNGAIVSLNKYGKIVLTTDPNDDFIIGVVDNTIDSLSNDYNYWPKKYVRDENGNYIYDDKGVKMVSKNFNPSLEYIPRNQRSEWYKVCILGKTKILKQFTELSKPWWIRLNFESDKYVWYYIR